LSSGAVSPETTTVFSAGGGHRSVGMDDLPRGGHHCSRGQQRAPRLGRDGLPLDRGHPADPWTGPAVL